MNRYFVQVAYDGTAFNGSQVQGTLPTVQLAVNKALSTLLRRPIESYGASRTDEGVHALSNMYHFDADPINADDFKYRMNALVPKELAIINIKQTINRDANCRFDAIKRRYRYKIHFSKNPFANNRSYFFPFAFATDRLHETAATLLRHVDFETFCKRNSQTFTHLCTIHESYWNIKEDGLEYIVCANRFLRGMVRALVGTQLNCARGKFEVEDFEKRIMAQDCSLADFSVPGHGLYLEEIIYPEDYFL